MYSLPTTLAQTPPRASISRTRVPLPTPPNEGLQDSSPMVSSLLVKRSVRAPVRAEPAAASHPACPPPMTQTKKTNTSGAVKGVDEVRLTIICSTRIRGSRRGISPIFLIHVFGPRNRTSKASQEHSRKQATENEMAGCKVPVWVCANLHLSVSHSRPYFLIE